MIDAVLNGYGIAFVPENLAEQHIGLGDLPEQASELARNVR
jgi:DNA-binding transcriptional LysR family regulator